MSVAAIKPLEELERFPLAPGGKPGKKATLAYERDGVVCLRGAFNEEWVSLGRRAVAAALRSRTRTHSHQSHTKRGDAGAFFYDTFVWKRLRSFRKFTFESPAATLARDVMRSSSLLLYFDMAIVKEPGTTVRTPWHYDEAYWPVSGTQVCNVWVALDHVPRDVSLRFVLGSHRMTTNYSAAEFFTGEGKFDVSLPVAPRWDLIEGDHRIACTEMFPGDCVILNLRTHHCAPGNPHRRTRRRAICTHWFGDDARFDDKPWECGPDERGEKLSHGGSLECETFPRVI